MSTPQSANPGESGSSPNFRAISIPTRRFLAASADRADANRLALVASLIQEVVWEWDLDSGELSLTERWRDIVGEPVPDSPTMETWRLHVHPNDRDRMDRAIDQVQTGAAADLYFEHRLRHADGHDRYVEALGQVIPGASRRVVGVIRDNTRRRLMEGKLLFDTYHDSVTGLPNRTSIEAAIERAIDRRRLDPAYRFTVIVLNIDRFHHVADGHGQAAGNQLLVAVAERLRSCVRPSDALARLAGDEFAILLDDIDGFETAARVGDRIRANLSDPIPLGSEQVYVSLSMGSADSRESAATSEAFLQGALAAANLARAAGRAGSRYFSPSMLLEKRRSLRRETHLRRALDQRDFSLRYQPIVSLADGEWVALEALVRWNHPTDGEIEPAQFISVAEETGLIVPLGQWVCREACRQIALWNNRFSLPVPLGINVNLSRRQMSDPEMVPWVSRLIEEERLAPGSLRFEITESLMMADVESAATLCRALRDLGARIHVDDFGTGYSSLAAIPSLPLDCLKIDRSFVSRMHDCPRTFRIVQTIIALGHGLGLEVTAEGIETVRQRDGLARLGCHHGQGYYYSAPMTPSEVEAFLCSMP